MTKTKKSAERRVLLGRVPVDTAHLVLADPCYIEQHWLPESQAVASDIRFWGRDQEAARASLEKAPEIGEITAQPGSVYAAFPAPGYGVFAVQTRVAQERENGKLIVWSEHDNSTQQELFEASCGPSQGGPALDEDAVVFRTGFGDGMYEVWATYRDFGDLGERITKVEVNLIEEGDDDA